MRAPGRRLVLLALLLGLLPIPGTPGASGAQAAKRGRAPARKPAPKTAPQAEKTDAPAPSSLPARLDLSFPGRQGYDTVVDGLITVPAGRSSAFLLTGEIRREDERIDSFRYRFDLPAGQEGDIPLAFQRQIHPGDYELSLRLEDVASGRAFETERPISVPAVDAPPAPSGPLAEADAALGTGDSALRILPPHSQLQTGMVRLETVASADVAQVTFLLDGRPVLTKRKPPFSVELDMGPLPRPRSLAANAFDASGRQVASDEIVVNASPSRFRVKLTEPRAGQRYRDSLLAKIEVASPDGEDIDHVDLFLDEAHAVSLFQPPWSLPIVLPKGRPPAYLRAVAFLTDGGSNEDVVFIGDIAGIGEPADRRYVEIYASAIDGEGRPVADLSLRDIAVAEAGAPRTVARFERAADLPLHVLVTLDLSAAMAPWLGPVRDATSGFLEGTLQPKDRAAVVTFQEQPFLMADFTPDLHGLGLGLAGLKPALASQHNAAALWDAVVFSLFDFSGLTGQRAIVLLTAGKDQGSRFRFEDALDYARRAGVAVYAIGLGSAAERKNLERLAAETGGRAWFLQSDAELAAVYQAIRDEVKSKYLIAYPTSISGGSGGSGGFRTIALTASRPGVTLRTAPGYFP
jgi:VWFA-related protein